MPNWVYNDVTIEGSKEDIAKVKKQLNKPFSLTFESFDGKETTHYTEPVFAFYNILPPPDLEAYGKQPDRLTSPAADLSDPDWWAKTKAWAATQNDWYNWNTTNWGTKWDVAMPDDETYKQTYLANESEDMLSYHFETAWSVPEPVLVELSKQYPECKITVSYEEETGWGGEFELINGELNELLSYDERCNDCGYISIGDTIDYCETCDYTVCPKCGYGASKECQDHAKLITTP